MTKKFMVASAGTGQMGLTETQLAEDLNLSVFWLRKDRQTKRILPYYRIGGAIRYNRDRVLQALARLEEGGAA